jgi:hypothetical protein
MRSSPGEVGHAAPCSRGLAGPRGSAATSTPAVQGRPLDLLRGRSVRKPLDTASEVAVTGNPDPLEVLTRQEAVNTAVSRFADRPVLQRSVVVLKNVLDESLTEIATLLDLLVDAVKAHWRARGRARLRQIDARADPLLDVRPPSAAVSRCVTLFNQRDWDALRSLLADDVKLNQSTRSFRVGRAEVGMFFTVHVQSPEVLAGSDIAGGDRSLGEPRGSQAELQWLEWTDGRIKFIRDYSAMSSPRSNWRWRCTFRPRTKAPRTEDRPPADLAL